MKKEPFCTTDEQSQMLIDNGLSIGTADVWKTSCVGGYEYGSIRKSNSKPCWSLSRLVEMVKEYHIAHTEIDDNECFFDGVLKEVNSALVSRLIPQYMEKQET